MEFSPIKYKKWSCSRNKGKDKTLNIRNEDSLDRNEDSLDRNEDSLDRNEDRGVRNKGSLNRNEDRCLRNEVKSSSNIRIT
jgi:hypothetical protein